MDLRDDLRVCSGVRRLITGILTLPRLPPLCRIAPRQIHLGVRAGRASEHDGRCSEWRVRPVAISEAWYRMVMLFALTEVGASVGRGLAPMQVGVGSLRSIQTSARAYELLPPRLREWKRDATRLCSAASAVVSSWLMATLAGVHLARPPVWVTTPL